MNVEEGGTPVQGISGLVALALEFDLPYALLVPDGFGPRREADYAEFQFTAQDLPITLRFARMLRTEKSTLIDLSKPQQGTVHTRVQMWVDGPALQELAGSPDYRAHAEELIDLAMSVVNRYVTLYRDMTGSYWLRALTRRDIPEFAFVGVLRDGRKLSLMYETGNDEESPEPLDATREQTLRERFASTYEADPLRSLAFTVRDLLARGEYWQAVLVVGLLCEARLARALQRPGHGEAPRSPEELLRDRLPGIDDPTTPLGQAYARWRETVGAFREQVARGESPRVGEDEAGRAIVAVWGLLEEVERLLRSSGERSDS